MKKFFAMLFIVSLAFGIVACGDEEVPIVNPTNTASISGISDISIDFGVTFDGLNGVTASDTVDGDISSQVTVSGFVNTNTPGTYTLTYKVTGSDGNEVTATRKVTVLNEDGVIPEPTEIVIMHGAPYEVDPFHTNFTGIEQNAKQALQREVEERLNVTVTYKPYPDSAAWGPSRVTAIINSSVAGDQLADIYWTTSDWMQQLSEADAIVSVDQYMSTYGANIHSDYTMVGSYKDHVYGFGPDNLTVDVGLYYNTSLVTSLGVDNPTELFLDGLWTWSRFEAWATQVQTALSAQGEDFYALGGVLSDYVESMVPLNGGSLINRNTQRVAFAQNPALETYTFLSDLWTKGLFEPAGQYDSGSPLWQSGKVAIHPGHLWFVNADNRWGNLTFELGFVPYPRSDSFTGEYVSPISGVAIYNVASGMTPVKEALAFQVWNELQMWKTEAELKDDFELSLLTKFDDEIFVEAYLEIYDKVYLELINAMGINPYTEFGFRRVINGAIRDGIARTEVDRIAPIYEAAIIDYFN